MTAGNPPPARLSPPAIVLHELTLRQGGRLAVEALSGCFAPGSLTAVVGPNGAGKTTLLQAIAGLHPVASGRIARGPDPGAIALLAQASTLDRGFPITCGEVVALGQFRRTGPFRSLGRTARAAAEAALAAAGLEGFAGRAIGALSAGQFQRVMFARLIVQDAPVLLLDEPFTALDEATTEALTGLIRRWHEEGRSIVAVLHDLALVAREFPETLLLSRRAIGWGPTAAVLSQANLELARIGAPPLDRLAAEDGPAGQPHPGAPAGLSSGDPPAGQGWRPAA